MGNFKTNNYTDKAENLLIWTNCIDHKKRKRNNARCTSNFGKAGYLDLNLMNEKNHQEKIRAFNEEWSGSVSPWDRNKLAMFVEWN